MQENWKKTLWNMKVVPTYWNLHVKNTFSNKNMIKLVMAAEYTEYISAAG